MESSWFSLPASSLFSESPRPFPILETATQLWSPATMTHFAGRASTPTAIAFIDASVQDYQFLTAAIAPDTAIYLLNSSQDALTQITQTLLHHQDIASVHIISHGSAGQLQVGNTWLDATTLEQYRSHLQTWGTALTADADILLYGCEIGAGAWGEAFVRQFAHLTGADIAASNTLTGSAALGGDWVLEVNTGDIAATLIGPSTHLAAYQHVLPIQLVSATAGGTQGNGDSWAVNLDINGWSLRAANSSRQSISEDGRYVLLTSQATNLSNNDPNGSQDDVFLHDRTTGETILVSAQYNPGANNNNTGVTGNRRSFNPVMSADGRYVAFTSTATNLVSTDGNGADSDVFLWDRVSRQTTLISRRNNGDAAGGESFGASISRDGKRIVFTNSGNFLGTGDYYYQVFVYEWDTAPTSGTVRQVSLNNAGQTGNGQSALDFPAMISGDGRYVVFQSQANNLIDLNNDLIPDADSNDGDDVFVRDLTTNQTMLVSVNSNNTGSGNQGSFQGAISENGRYIAFLSKANNLVSGGSNGARHAYVRDMVSGMTQLVSVDSNEVQAYPWVDTAYVTLSGDGQSVVFVSSSDNLATGDTNGERDVFVRELATGTTRLVSGNLSNVPGNGASGSQQQMMPAVSYDGRYIVFSSTASDLVATDTNGFRDVFLYDRTTGTTMLVSQNRFGSNSGNGASDFAGMNRSGTAIGFTSAATDLVASDTNSKLDVFVSTQGNLPPIAANDTFGTLEETPLSGNVTTNDNDPDNGLPLSVSLVTGTNHGSLSLNANGTFHYTPNTDYSGTDTFTYSVRDSLGATSGLASVVLSVTATNDAPVAVNDSYIFATGAPFNPALGVLMNDTDVDTPLANLTASMVDAPLSGNLVLNPNGTFTYTPNAGFTGSDRFTYRASDGNRNSGLATVSLAVTATLNTPPIAVNDTATGNEDTILTGNVLSNDSDPNGHLPLSATVMTAPTQGSLSLNANGTFRYTPTVNTHGSDTFTYIARDTLGAASGTATVVLTVNSVNDAPSFTTGPQQTIAAGAGTQTLANWATGFNPGATNEAAQAIARYQIVSNSNPSIFATNPSIDPTGILTYTPVAAIANPGSAVIGVRVQDDGGTANGGTDLSATQFFTITVTAQPTLTVSAVSQQEGNSGTSPLNFTVSLSHASATTVSVQYGTADGTASVTDGDYSVTGGTLIFLPGETVKVIAVPVLGDTRLEPTETFQLTLSQAINAQIGGGSATGTILNDDAQPTIRVNGVTRQEGHSGNSNFWFTVTLSHASYQSVSVGYATADGTATQTGDYLAAGGTLVFAPGETSKVVAVSVTGDRTIEPTETFSLTLQNAVNGTIATTSAIATILNDDSVTTSDFNQDGINDIVWRNYTTGENQVWLMNATLPSSVMQLPAVATNWILEGVADFNQDGNPDLLWREYDWGTGGIWYMAGASILSTGAIPTVATNWQIEGVGDFNRDNQADILWRDTSSGLLGIWYMNGSEISFTTGLNTVGMDWVVDAVVDFNQDGQVDIIWRYAPTGNTGAWLMYGSPAALFFATLQLPSPMNPSSEVAAIADFNRDGKVDILWRNHATGGNQIWLLDGTRSIAQISTQSLLWGWFSV